LGVGFGAGETGLEVGPGGETGAVGAIAPGDETGLDAGPDGKTGAEVGPFTGEGAPGPGGETGLATGCGSAAGAAGGGETGAEASAGVGTDADARTGEDGSNHPRFVWTSGSTKGAGSGQ
jgi:hypothetical protein